MKTSKVEITVVFSNDNVLRHVENAMADATVEARGRLESLPSASKSRAKDMEEAVRLLQHMHSCVAELLTLDG